MRTAAERRTHLEELAKELGCKVHFSTNPVGMMYVEFGYIETPFPDDQFKYMVGLHELGHIAWGHTQGRPPHTDKTFYFDNGVLKSEAQAWEWALDHTKEALDYTTRLEMWDSCLGAYYSYSQHYNDIPTRLTNGNRHYVEFIFDKPDSYFWSIVERIRGTDSQLWEKSRSQTLKTN